MKVGETMHEKYMKIALNEAKKGLGFTNPNPLVGAVILKDETIIAKGYHASYGENHAEIHALNQAKDKAEGATMYVTLEPCSHYGKTPPCALAIIKAKIKTVIIASKDPNPLVGGRGIQMLKEAGIEVLTGILDQENQTLNKVFFHYIQEKNPYLIMKTAMSIDGKIATKTHDSKWITNAKSREFVHETRAQTMAIMVGYGTILHDNPQLTARLDKPVRQPIRIICDTYGQMPIESRVLDTTIAKTIVVTSNLAPKDKLKAFKEKGAEHMLVPLKDKGLDLTVMMAMLKERQIDSILLEGGSTLNDAAIRAGIVHEIHSFIAPMILGGKDALTPVDGLGFNKIKHAKRFKRTDILTFDDDVLIVYEARDDDVHRDY